MGAQDKCAELADELARERRRGTAEASLAAGCAADAQAAAQDMAEQLELAHAELEVRKQGFLWVTPCHERFLRCRVWRVLFPCCQPLDTCSLTSARTSSSRPFVYPSMDFGAELYSAGNLLLGSLAGEEHERIAVKSQHWG